MKSGRALPKLISHPWRDVLIMVGLLVFVMAMKPIGIVDDAFISFRYAHNLAHHGEFVFNLGERVEGITNFLWSLLLGGSGAIGFEIPYSALILSILLIFWMGIRTWQLANHLTSRSVVGIQVWSVVLLSSGFWGTMTSGLEAPLFAALVLEILYQYAQGKKTRAFFFAGLAFFTRPEGLGLILLLYAITAYQERSFQAGLKGLGLAMGMVFSLELFRFLYYGSWVPNSVIAKSFPLRMYFNRWLLHNIYSYISGFLTSNIHLLIAVLGGALLFLRSDRKRDTKSSLFFFSLGGFTLACAAVVKNGGDWMAHYRLLFQYAPVYVVPLIYLIEDKILHPFVWVALVVGLILPLYPAYPVSNVKKLLSFQQPVEEKYYGWWFLVETGDRLESELSRGDTVAAEGVGYISYRLNEQYIHDPLGLANPYLARNGTPYIMYGKGDPTYTLSEVEPDVVIVHNQGFIEKAEQHLLDRYRPFCFQSCGSAKADIVMIHYDRVQDLGTAFQDWERVNLHSEKP